MAINEMLTVVTIILVSLMLFLGLNPIFALNSYPRTLPQVNVGGLNSVLCLDPPCNTYMLDVAKSTNPLESSEGDFSDELILPAPSPPGFSDNPILPHSSNELNFDNVNITERIISMRAIENGQTLNSAGLFVLAIPSFDRAIAANSSSVGVAYALEGKGTAMVGLERYQEAITYFDRAIDVAANDVPRIPAFNSVFSSIFTNKGLALHQLERYQEAITYFDRAIEVNKGGLKVDRVLTIDALINKGASLSVLGRYQEAIEQYDKVLVIQPYDEDALNNKGNALSSLGRHQEAAELYDKALEALQNPLADKETKIRTSGFQIDTSNDYSELIKYTQYKTGNLEKAIHNTLVFETSTSLNNYEDFGGLKYVTLSKDTEVIIIIQFNKGVDRYVAKNYVDANNNFDKVLEMNSSFPPGLFYKDLCLQKLGETDKAKSFKEKFDGLKSNYKGERLDTKLISVPDLPLEQMFISQ